MILSEARSLLFDAVVPHINDEINVSQFNRALNFISERFINSGDWKGNIKEIAIVATDDYLTLPPRFQSCLAVRYANAQNQGSLVNLKNQWFKFTPAGSYLWKQSTWSDAGYVTDIADMGDGFVTFRDSPYAVYKLRVTLENVGDGGLKILFKGYNGVDGSRLFTDQGSISIDGEILQVTGTIATTVSSFTGKLDYVLKQGSQGFVKVEAVDTATAGVTTIARYAPSERAINYRRYNVGGKPGDIVVINAICRLRYIPIEADDEVIPSNAGAVESAYGYCF
jgi:hypothetical protein